MKKPASLEEIIAVRAGVLGAGERAPEITGLMEEIGFQANLLALRAALSAAAEQMRLEAPPGDAPPAAVRRLPSAPEKHRKDS